MLKYKLYSIKALDENYATSINNFLTLLATYTLALYLDYLHDGTYELFNATVFSACFGVSVISIIILLYLESEKFGYGIVLLSAFTILGPIFAMEVLNFDKNSV